MSKISFTILGSRLKLSTSDRLFYCRLSWYDEEGLGVLVEPLEYMQIKSLVNAEDLDGEEVYCMDHWEFTLPESSFTIITDPFEDDGFDCEEDEEDETQDTADNEQIESL